MCHQRLVAEIVSMTYKAIGAAVIAEDSMNKWTREVLGVGPLFFIGWVGKDDKGETFYQQPRPEDGIYYALREDAENALKEGGK